MDICEYIKLKGNSNVVIGHTLDALTNLAVPIDVNIANFVAAVVKHAATRGNTRLGKQTKNKKKQKRLDVSIGFSESEIKAIVTKRIKAAAEADGLTQRAKSISNTFPTAHEARGDM